MIAVPTYGLVGCSANDSTDVSLAKAPENKDCLANGAKATAISSNHGHTLPVAKADIVAGFEKTYSIQGSSKHNHPIVVTSANLETVKSDKTI